MMLSSVIYTAAMATILYHIIQLFRNEPIARHRLMH